MFTGCCYHKNISCLVSRVIGPGLLRCVV